MRHAVVALLAVAAAASVQAGEPATQSSGSRTPAIQDNSLLVEEAFNQEPGVVQHINVFLRDLRTNRWFATFTQEYPVGGVRDQLSYTIPYQQLDTGAESVSGLGDVALNYRYQLVGSGEARVAVAPRLTVFLPTGDTRKGFGAGSTGVQIALPLSAVLSESWVAHANVGATFTPSARDEQGDKANTLGYNLGTSLIWTGGGTFNGFVEVVWSEAPIVSGFHRTQQQTSFLISPSVRWAYNFASGLQVVPAIGIPIGVGSSRGQRSVLFYLSFEHPFQQVPSSSSN
jgi:Putative MetA-pathway of phenol degradation